MKKCLICYKEIEDDEEVCHSCKVFLKWKYGRGYSNKIKQFRKFRRENSSLNLIKSDRRYKNE